MKDSKNHAVCARRHLVCEHSGDDCTIMSSGVSGSHKASVRLRVARNRSAIWSCGFGEAVALIMTILYPESVPEIGCPIPVRVSVEPLRKCVTRSLDGVASLGALIPSDDNAGLSPQFLR